MKLTTRQKANIVSAYAAGGVSMATLAQKYGVSEKTIHTVIHEDEKLPEKVRPEKKEAEMSMLDYIASRRSKAQSLMDMLIDMPVAMIEKASMRDRMGALKILSECFAASEAERLADTSVTISLEVRDLTIKDKTDES